MIGSLLHESARIVLPSPGVCQPDTSVGDSANAQGGVAWLREQGRDILDLASPECIEMLGNFQRTNPQLWNECVGDG